MREPDPNAAPVENNTAQHRFELPLPESLALLKYHYDRAGRLSLDHTEVPQAYQHHGLAALLAKTALDFARERGLKVFPKCPYVVAYLAAHPELEPLVDRNPLP